MSRFLPDSTNKLLYFFFLLAVNGVEERKKERLFLFCFLSDPVDFQHITGGLTD